MNECTKCGAEFDHYISFHTDICDKCTEIVENKSIHELEKEDSKYDDLRGEYIEHQDKRHRKLQASTDEKRIHTNQFR